MYVHEHHRSKLDDRCFKGRFIGYGDSNGIKAYKIYNSHTGKVVYSRSVKFDEDWLFDEGKSSSGTLHMDGGASIQELQPDAAEGDTTIKDGQRIKTSTRTYGKGFILGKQATHARANSPPCSRSIYTTTETSTQDRTKKRKTRSLREIYDVTNMIENCFVSIVDSDVSALHSYVTDDTVAFVPILTLR